MGIHTSLQAHGSPRPQARGEGDCKATVLQNVFKLMADVFEICFHGLDEHPLPPAGEGSRAKTTEVRNLS